jgi:hypothetical protein
METVPPLRMPAILGYTLLETLWQDDDLALWRGKRDVDQAASLVESPFRIDVEPRALQRIERQK